MSTRNTVENSGTVVNISCMPLMAMSSCRRKPSQITCVWVQLDDLTSSNNVIHELSHG